MSKKPQHSQIVPHARRNYPSNAAKHSQIFPHDKRNYLYNPAPQSIKEIRPNITTSLTNLTYLTHHLQYSAQLLRHQAIPLHHPQPTINLVHNITPRISPPFITTLFDVLRHRPPLDQIRLLNQIHIQARTHMPSDMAMERPHARIIRVILQHYKPWRSGCATSYDLRVSALGVLLVDDLAVPFALAIS